MILICPRCKLRQKAEGRAYCRPCNIAYNTAYNAQTTTGHGPRARNLDTVEPTSMPELTGWAIDRRYSGLEAGNDIDVYYVLTQRTYRDRVTADFLEMGPLRFSVKRSTW
jgi:hypothetical protein